MSVSIVTWLWHGNRPYSPKHVNVLASMFRRNLGLPHKFICITDMTDGFADGVEVMPMPAAAKRLGEFQTPEAPGFPSCYRRLWMFSDEAKCLGDRVLMVDVDLVVTGSLDHLFSYEAPFVGWRPRMSWGHGPRLGGGIYLMTPGSHTEVYEDFKGQKSINEARTAGFRGSDQAWISHKIYGEVDLWPHSAGIYSVRDLGLRLPNDVRLVQFNGRTKPWHSQLPWVRKHWK
ncbi:hypothetical protein ABRY94_11735 [Castellaniella ginsengisoli]|uniref:Glycosyltransferase n=1 Tax=Castellaniella ginsengisoli TaxID=546114 RepID=A0AB39ER18_9BURK